jgi:hypothetical protein
LIERYRNAANPSLEELPSLNLKDHKDHTYSILRIRSLQSEVQKLTSEKTLAVSQLVQLSEHSTLTEQDVVPGLLIDQFVSGSGVA